MDYQQIAAQAGKASGTAIQCTGQSDFAGALPTGRFRLENGLTVVFSLDRRAPIFSYQTFFKVGSKHEDPSRTGLAHLFEHLMFKATKRFRSGFFDREMEARGAETNAATGVDYTNYVQSLATRDDHLETVIAFESDRMHNLDFDLGTFASELEVVKNERLLSVESSIEGMLTETLFETAFDKHGYHWPTIGYQNHLETMTVQAAADFYRVYYAPNNAIVVLVGDLDPTHALTAIAKAYTPISRSVLPAYVPVVEPTQTERREKRLSLAMNAPAVSVGYRVPSESDAFFTQLEAATYLLLDGDSSRLYRRMVAEERLALAVDGTLTPYSEPGLLIIEATGRQGVDPDKLIQAIQRGCDDLSMSVTEDEVTKAKNSIEYEVYESLSDAESTGEMLGHHEVNYGDFSRAFRKLDNLAHLTPHDIGQAMSRYAHANNRTAVIATPKDAD